MDMSSRARASTPSWTQLGIAAGQRSIDPGLSKIVVMRGGNALENLLEVAEAHCGVLSMSGSV